MDKKEKLVNKYFDKIIIEKVLSNYCLDKIIEILEDKKSEIVSKIPISVGSKLEYLIIKYLVIKKKIDDLNYGKTLIFNYSEYSKYSTQKIFKLIKLRDKLLPKDIESKAF